MRLTDAGRRLAVTVNESLHEWERALVGERQLRSIVGAIDDLIGLLEPEARPSLML